MPNFLQTMQQMWARLGARQRVVLLGGAAVTLITLLVMFKVLGSPEYKPLMVGLEPADVQAISAQLSAKKIPFQLTADGKGINVAADQLDAARLEIASDSSPHSGRMGFELFDKTSWGQTEFDEKVNYQRALEGELERTIGTLSGVKSARVHLVLPASSIFLDRERGAKASVALRMKRGSLSQDQLNAIAKLVSGAVDDLSPHDVTIVDADSNESLGHKSGTLEGRELEGELSKRLLETLGPAVGIDNLRASVNVEYDLNSSEESQDKYDPAVAAVLTSQKTQEQIGTGAGTGGVAGTSSNLPNTGAPQSAALPQDENGQTSSSDNSTFGVNKIVRHTVAPAGRIRRITAALLINDATDRKQVKGQWVSVPRKRTQAQLDQLAELARGVLGTDKERGDVLTVQNMTFDDQTTAEKPLTLVDTLRTRASDFATPLRYGAMLLLFVLIWALMVRPIQKQLTASLKQLPSPGVPQPLLEKHALRPELASALASVSIEGDPESASIKRELNELVLAEPASMTRTLQSWLREPQA